MGQNPTESDVRKCISGYGQDPGESLLKIYLLNGYKKVSKA